MGGGAGGGMGPGGMADMMKNQQANMQKQMQNMQQNMAGRMGPGAAGQAGGGAAAAKDDGPGDFTSPIGAVQAFLSALKAKDADRLSEATALRATDIREQTSTKSQDMFKKIQDLSLTDSEMDTLSKKLEGYSIAGENPPKSTGRADVVIQKSGENGRYSRRKITVRREKKGWGVLDIGVELEFKSQGMQRRGGMNKR
jgi:hypothetical protein